jgi:non-ribosomal peptide synthetase component F
MELYVALYGILKSGAAFVPIDPKLPAERVEYMLDDTRAQVVVCHGRTRSLFEERALRGRMKIVDLDQVQAHLWQHPVQVDERNIDPLSTADDLCYVIYTSGSTG